MPRSRKGGYESTAESPKPPKPPKGAGPGAEVKRDPKALSDKKLAEMGRAREKIRLQIAALKTEQESLDKPILAELTRRGTKALEVAGVKVTKVEQPMTTYSYPELRRLLGKKAGRYRKQEVDVAALSVAVQAGDVPAEVIDAISTTGTKAPYISVSFTAP